MFSTWTLLACLFVLAGGVTTYLRPVAAKGHGNQEVSQSRPILVDRATVRANFKAVPVTGPVTIHSAGHLYFQDGHDLPDGETTEGLLAATGTASQPTGVMTADFNNDGTEDIVTVYGNAEGQAYATFRTQNGHGSFSTSQASVIGAGVPVAVRATDFDRDGNLDLVFINQGRNSITMSAGNGQGGFTPAVDLTVGTQPTTLAMGDLNHNGVADVIVGDANGEFRVLSPADTGVGYADASIKTFKASAPVIAVETVDLNGDRFQDVVVATAAGIETWLGDSTGELKRKDKLAAAGLVGLTVADLNLDRKDDIVAVSGTGDVTVWNNKGNGFSAGQSFKAAKAAVSVKANWVDVDAYRDIVVVDQANNEMAILLNQKGRGFAAPVTVPVDSQPADVAFGRFDIDGVNDVVVAKKGGTATALTYVPNQATTIAVTDLSNIRQIPANGTTTDLTGLARVTFLDALTAANNTPGPQTITFQVSEANAISALNGLNLREPFTNTPNSNSLQFPNTTIAGTTGERLYNVNLKGATALNGILSLVLTSPNGDGTVIDGDNVLSGNSIINKLGPDTRIVGDATFNCGFEIGAANCVIRNLIITGFTNTTSQGGVGASAIEISGVQSQNNQIQSVYLGSLDLFGSTNFFPGAAGSFTNANVLPEASAGTAMSANRHGVRINGAGNTTVSTTTEFINIGRRTLISGNQDHGLLLEGGSSSNLFTTLFIGTTFNGSTPHGNGSSLAAPSGAAGIELRNSATGNTIRNCVISCSGREGGPGRPTNPGVNGVVLRTTLPNNAGPSNNRFENNIIGLQSDGINPPLFSDLVVCRNTGFGVAIQNSATFNAFTQNTISANTFSGVLMTGLGTNRNTFTENRIGTDITGRLSNGGNPASNNRGNLLNGMEISEQAALNTLDNNTISNNLGDGVQLTCSQTFLFTTGNQGTDGNTLVRNKIGTDSGATTTSLGANLANGLNGVSFGDLGAITNEGNVQLNTLDRNLIFFNRLDGVISQGQFCDFNTFTQNSVIGNGQRGFRIATGATGSGTIAGREGPELTSGFRVAQEKYTTTNEDNGLNPMPEIPGPPLPLPTAAVVVDSALLNGNVLQVTGRIGRFYGSIPNTFRIEVYASNTTDVSARARGIAQRYLGFTTVTGGVTPATWSFTVTGVQGTNTQVQVGEVITATLRSPNGSTSEISVAKQVDQGAQQGTPAFSINRVNAGPPVSLTPISSVDFGDVPINSAQQSVTVRVLSTGTLGAPITINSITLTNAGGTPSQFSISTAGIAFPITLAPTVDPVGTPGSFVDFIVTETGTSLGVKTGEVTLNIATTVGQNYLLPLRVNITGQQISTNPAAGSTINFGSVQVGNTSTAQNVVISNTGSANLTVNLSLSGDYIFDTGFNSATQTIAPNGALTVPIRFRPVTTGTRTGALQIGHDAQNTTSPIVINLTGTGTAPPPPPAPNLGGITLNGQPVGSLLDFGNVPVGQTATRQLVVSNTGNGTLIFNGFTTGDAFSANASATTIAGNSTATVTVTFVPNAAADFTGTLNIGTNAANAPNVTISLKGRGTAPAIAVNPPSISFGNVTINQTSSQTMTITNTGNDVLTVNAVSVTGQGFQVQGVPSGSFQVQAGSSQSFQVTFAPTSTGNFSGAVTINSNARNQQTVTASLTGSSADSISPTVNVSEPRSGQAFAAGSRTSARFTASDNAGVTSIDIQLVDGGGLNSLATGLPGNTTSFDVVFPNTTDSSNVRVRVVARDAAGNTGQGESGTFTVGPAPQVIAPKLSASSGKLKLQSFGSNISVGGAQLLINSTPVPLVAKNTKFVTSTSVTNLIPTGATVQLSVRNPNGVVGPTVSFTRR
ncbi:MAG: choice-of-anchor D domain-containing protein [Blastocatellia bacterium]|nr:choice-of-anchor D domain-containing protein [Blastocatellia bacterium]